MDRADDVTIAQIIGTGATIEELTEAQTWLANDESMLTICDHWRGDGRARSPVQPRAPRPQRFEAVSMPDEFCRAVLTSAVPNPVNGRSAAPLDGAADPER
ncbi:hypothetical protein RAD15_28105 [Bradyrhizobium sp. 14AA]